MLAALYFFWDGLGGSKPVPETPTKQGGDDAPRVEIYETRKKRVKATTSINKQETLLKKGKSVKQLVKEALSESPDDDEEMILLLLSL